MNKTHIQKNVTQLDRLYINNINNMQALYFAKLAIIEVCGWIEESMDEIVLSCASRHLTNTQNISYVENVIVGRTNSFEYEQHFRLMLMRILGIIGLEKLEMSFNATKFNKMKASLIFLKTRRDEQAHTHIQDMTMNIDAPSVIISHFQNVYDGLKHIENLIRKV
jgi:hypothetical protein